MDIMTGLVLQDKMTNVLTRQLRATDNLVENMAQLDVITERAANNGANIGFGRTADAVERAAQETDNFSRKQNSAGNAAKSAAEKAKQGWGGAQKVMAAAAALFGLKKITDFVDAYNLIPARLNLMNDGMQTTAQLQDKIFASANRSRAAYMTTADAVAKMGIMASDAFTNNDELIAFLEQVNKQFAIAGTSSAGIDAAMLQLTQAMASGVLRGEELNSIFEQAPTIVQAIADYLDVPIGTIRELAQEGKITADVVKNAMFAAAEETDAKFAAMPMTFGQVGAIMANMLLQTFDPVIQAIGQGAQWIYDNWAAIEPIFWGLVGAVGAYVAITAICTAFTWLQEKANRALMASMLSNPILWIAIAIGVLVGLIYKWVQSVGGLQIAWLIVCDALLTAFTVVQIGFFTGIYWIIGLWDKLVFTLQSAGVAIANYMGDMKTNVLMLLQNLVNGAIGILNQFIGLLNQIPGVSIDLIGEVTFGTAAELENEAAKQARNEGLDAARAQMEAAAAERDAKLNTMKAEAQAATAQRQAEIAAAQAEKASQTTDEGTGLGSFGTSKIDSIGSVGEVGKIKDEVDISAEDLELLRDIAEMRFVQNFVTLTPQVSLKVENVNENADIDYLLDEAEQRLEEEFVSAAERVYS